MWIQEVTTGMRERERERSWQLGVGRQGGGEKENKIVTLGTERCKYIKKEKIGVHLRNSID